MVHKRYWSDGRHPYPCQSPYNRPCSLSDKEEDNFDERACICTFNLRFCYVLSGWEGTAHDQRVFAEALKVDFKIPEGLTSFPYFWDTPLYGTPLTYRSIFISEAV